jgi:ferredoxin-type protein NapH
VGVPGEPGDGCRRLAAPPPRSRRRHAAAPQRALRHPRREPRGHRGLLFGLGAGAWLIVAVFLFDLLVTRHGWCGHLCPVGAFYAAIGRASPLRVVAAARAQCNDCLDCYGVCPEPQVITPALKGEKKGIGPVITDAACTNCGRCIDVCSKSVFKFGNRYGNKPEIVP